jgi:hypothetical protein
MGGKRMDKICPLYKSALISNNFIHTDNIDEYNYLTNCDKNQCGMWRRDYIQGEGYVEYCGMGGPDKL